VLVAYHLKMHHFSSALGSRLWPLGVMWHNRLHLIRHRPFPIGGPLEPSLHLQPFLRYWALSVLESRPYVSGSRVSTHQCALIGAPCWREYDIKLLCVTLCQENELLRDVFGLGPPQLGTNAVPNKASKTERVSWVVWLHSCIVLCTRLLWLNRFKWWLDVSGKNADDCDWLTW